jgi:His/Glu/Gln/Arg/opine family amino acid ABC transporter permease subunit
MDFSQFIPNMIEIMEKYWRLFLLEGLKNTLILTFISVSMGTVLGALVALMRMSKLKLLRFLSSFYIEVIRGTPILLQLYIFYFVLPSLLPFLKLSQFLWVSIALCVNSAAYVSEVIRSGIQAVDKGQMEAARCLGLSEGQAMLKIILPQAVRNILPALGNEFIMMLKETSLASTFFLYDLMTVCNVVKGAEYLTLEPMTIVALIYLCMTFPLSKLVGYFEKKMANPNSYRSRKHNRKKEVRI